MTTVTNILRMPATVERTEPVSDLDLAKAAAAGSSEAFEQLYHLHYRRVYTLCWRMLGRSGPAEDLTQEVFMLLHRKIATFRGDSRFSTWLHRMTVNLVLMHFRKRGVKVEHTSEDGDFSDVVETPCQSTKRISMVERIDLERAIAELPPGYRTVFVLHDIEGYEHEEISGLLNVSIGTSKSQLHRARMRLRELLQNRH